MIDRLFTSLRRRLSQIQVWSVNQTEQIIAQLSVGGEDPAQKQSLQPVRVVNRSVLRGKSTRRYDY